jgi:hypothetical protein
MNRYLVTWSIDEEADNPTDAAILAKDSIKRGNSFVFEVKNLDTGKIEEIDLSDE